MTSNERVVSPSSDHFRRFSSLNWVAHFFLMGRRIRLETNSQMVWRAMQRLGNGCGKDAPDPDFRWSIVTDPDSRPAPPLAAPIVTVADGLYLFSYGQGEFMACDEGLRWSVAFLAEVSAEELDHFWRLFLTNLVATTCYSLGLSLVSGFSLRVNGQPFIVFDTSSSAENASRFKPDWSRRIPVLFLEEHDGGVRVWDQFWPMVLGHEVGTRMDFPHSGSVESVAPSAVVFLEKHRGQGSTIAPIKVDQRLERLENYEITYSRDRRGSSTLRALSQLPFFVVETESLASQRLRDLLSQIHLP